MPRGQRTTLKTYGWTAHFSDDTLQRRLGVPTWVAQCRAICAAPTQVAVVRAAGAKYPKQLFNLCETGNVHEKAVAEAKPGVVFVRGLDRAVSAEGWIEYDPHLYGRIF